MIIIHVQSIGEKERMPVLPCFDPALIVGMIIACKE